MALYPQIERVVEHTRRILRRRGYSARTEQTYTRMRSFPNGRTLKCDARHGESWISTERIGSEEAGGPHCQGRCT